MTFNDLAGSGFLESISQEEVGRSVHYVSPAGKEYHGGEAISRAGRLTKLHWLPPLLDLPLIWVFREVSYGLMATLGRSLSRVGFSALLNKHEP